MNNPEDFLNQVISNINKTETVSINVDFLHESNSIADLHKKAASICNGILKKGSINETEIRLLEVLLKYLSDK